MHRVHNFCAGPASLPQPVLEMARDEMLDWHRHGMSIMEMSHRSKAFEGVIHQAQQDLRDLLAIPDHYRVLFVQGGASTQFSAVPLNLLASGRTADYFNTGQWSKKAIKEAKRFGTIHVAASSEDHNFLRLPSQTSWNLTNDAAYVHYTPNETIGGLEFDAIPEVNAPLVADMSSTILSRPCDVERFGVIYAGAQKNIGPAGLTVVIVREDLLGNAQSCTPLMLDWQAIADNDSMLNTPPTYSVYLAGLVFKWLKDQGGLAAMAVVNKRKSDKLYSYIDQSGFYANPIEKRARSWMNIPFTLLDDALDKVFLQAAESQGLMNLKGHRSVGGMRASIYNAVPEQAIDDLIVFMEGFANKHGH